MTEKGPDWTKTKQEKFDQCNSEALQLCSKNRIARVHLHPVVVSAVPSIGEGGGSCPPRELEFPHVLTVLNDGCVTVR